MAIALMAGVISLGIWLHHRATHIHVTDSRIASHVVVLSSEVTGRLLAIPVVVGQHVSKGDLLAAIDRSQSRLQLREIEARMEAVSAQQAQLRAQQDMVRRQVNGRLQAARSQLLAAEADRHGKMAERDNARDELERLSALYKTGAVSAQLLDTTRAQFISTQQQELRAAAGIDTARANLTSVQAEEAQAVVLERQITMLEAQKAALAAQRQQQLIDLDKRAIHAQFDGVIDQTFAEAGEYVSPGMRVLMYHDPKRVWVDANIKETDFDRLKIGASATVTVDAYPHRRFTGKVTHLGQATTSEFALLPNPNPSGNFTKVTQRLPVRIAVAQQDDLLRPGMMVEVSIDATTGNVVH
ncbi:HlyD family secretion protein [Steroidobacter denitrificans]|nr:HlyD family secretion protein [Steroidobacter denitrificans]